MRARGEIAALAALILTGLSACDTGPVGPATIAGTVTGPADLGAVVLDVVWAGVQGFEGQGSTQVYSAQLTAEKDRHRVILVGPAGGDLSFGILVDDLYLEGPLVTVVEAVATDNLSRSVDNIRVLLER
jgi:hypothetical protein